MPHLIVTDGATEGLERCRRFLAGRDANSAIRAASTIKAKLRLLMTQPAAGRRIRGWPGVRELVIPFGSSGYLALYRHVAEEDAVYVLAIRHQREADY